MKASVRRATAFALVATLGVVEPVLGPVMAVPFALIAVVARVTSQGPIFEVFARPGERLEGELTGLIGFALGATALALLTALSNLPTTVFVGTVLLLGYGDLGEELIDAGIGLEGEFNRLLGFLVAGATVATIGQLIAGRLGTDPVATPIIVFLSIVGTLLAALLRATLAHRDDPLVLLPVALALWLVFALGIDVAAEQLAAAVIVTSAFGYLSWTLDTASISGMLTGMFISLVTIVLGGFGWFGILITFFGIGGLASKYRYDEKAARGVAEENQGARASSNVLGNAAVALMAVIGYAAGPHLSADPHLFRFAFAGTLATATSDTLSSEIGSLYGPTRLITTFELVDPGTDGGVSWQGELAGLVGAGIIAGLASILLGISSVGTLVVVIAGFIGMTVDSLLGATIEGGWIGNQTVNFLATLAGGIVGPFVAAIVGLI
ncbi:MAG: TIGR00297 family protein [Halobacteriales archaeon]